jgi:hypothetical protein
MRKRNVGGEKEIVCDSGLCLGQVQGPPYTLPPAAAAQLVDLYRQDRRDRFDGRWRCENGATKLTPQLIIHPGSFDANPVQEEVNGSLSVLLLGFWIRCDAVECEALGVSEHKIEEHVSRKFRVIYLNLTAGGGLPQNTRDPPDRAKPSFLVCQFCQLGKLDGLR